MNKTVLELTEEQERKLFDLVPGCCDDCSRYAIIGQALWQGPSHEQKFVMKFRRYENASAMFLWQAFKDVDFLDRLQGKSE